MRKKILGLIMFMVFVVGCQPSGYAAENIELSDIRCEGIGDKAQISGTSVSTMAAVPALDAATASMNVS